MSVKVWRTEVWPDLEWVCSGCGWKHTRAFINVLRRGGDDIRVVRRGNKVDVIRFVERESIFE